MLRVSEVYKKQVQTNRERPDGSEYAEFSKCFDSRECLINPSYIVAVHPYEFTSSLELAEVNSAFSRGTKFTTFILDGNSYRSSEIIVVGSFDKFCRILEPPKS